MNGPKIVVIGAGSYTFGFTMLHDAIVDHRLDGAEMHLVDLDLEMARGYAAIGERIAREHGVKMTFAAHDDRTKALDGADFVTTSIAVGLKTRAETDWRIALKHGILQTNSECGSVGGLSYTMRSVPLVLGVCRDMERLCPKATLLNVTNPLTRVVLAANRYSSIKTVGFCYVALVGRRLAAKALFAEPSDLDLDVRRPQPLLVAPRYPRQEDRAAISTPTCAPPPRRAFTRRSCASTSARRVTSQAPATTTWASLSPSTPTSPSGSLNLATGLPRSAPSAVRRYSGSPRARTDGSICTTRGSAPMDYVNAAVRDKATRFDFLNIQNKGAIPGLPEDMIVEVPADVDARGARAAKLPTMPRPLMRLLEPVAETCHWAVEAAVKGDLSAAHKAIEADPAIAAADRGAARAAFAEMLAAHADILANWRK